MNKTAALAIVLVCLLSALLLSAKNLLIQGKKSFRGIPILMYHGISKRPGRFNVKPDTFRSHLQKLYKAGYVTASLADVLAKNPSLKYKKIVLLRFDDSRRSQCNYIFDAQGKPFLDPDCATGIILDFYKKHPSFGKHAFFCLIPSMCFQQPRYCKQKLLFLLNEGMELVNHGFDHLRIADAQPATIDNNFGRAMAFWDTLLGPTAEVINCVAPPFGSQPSLPEAKKRLRCFEYNGKSYPQAAIVYAGRKYHHAAHSPFCKNFDPYDLPSFEVTEDNFDEILALLT